MKGIMKCDRITKCCKKLLQSVTRVTKFDNCFKVRRNVVDRELF